MDGSVWDTELVSQCDCVEIHKKATKTEETAEALSQ